ncbi:hypothetical protein DWW76_13030 [Coprobacillus sp. AF17-11AC]|nr:hypothetical protein DWW80_12100 [Coprobacillus sp. AF17-17AC]RGG83211.1 hypothetical protein DWW76_13030 [Coprobacillus sp. AF17-11AC]
MVTREEFSEKLFISLSASFGLDTESYLSTMISNNYYGENINKKIKVVLEFYSKNGYLNFRDTLLLIVDLCTPAESDKQLELLSRAYSRLGAKYRKETIISYEKYFKKINLENYKEEYPLFENGKEVRIKDKFHVDLLSDLLNYTKALEGEYEFENAFFILETANKLFPCCYTIYAKKFNILKKMNRLDDAIELIKKCLDSKWSQPYEIQIESENRTMLNDSNRRALLADLAKFTELKEKGYIYKPRKKNIKK